MDKDIQILLVDDHQVVRNGLQHMLELETGMSVVGEAADGESALSMVELLSPDIILMDIKMPGMDGIELTRQVKQKNPSCNVIMLTLYDQYVNQAMEAGAKGYLLKDIKSEELVQAIRNAHSGEVVVSDSIKSKTQFEYGDRYSKKSEEGSSVLIEEVQLVLPPPVEASRLMRFTSRAEEALHSRVLQVIGSWQEGTIMTIILSRAISVADILGKFRNMAEVEAVGEQMVAGDINPKLIKQADAMPRLKNRLRRTLFVTLEKN